MPGFAESFWSEDLSTGLTRLFSKLNQGIAENEEVLSLARRRAESEESHGARLQQIARDSFRKDGFNRDDGASLRRAFESMVKETSESAQCHIKVATNLQQMVIKPFGRWTHEHAIRVQSSDKELHHKAKEHEKHSMTVKKLRSTYFNKCRLLEDFEEENKLAFPGPDGPGTPNRAAKKTPEEIAADLNSLLDDEPVELGEVFYSAAQLKVLLESLLSTIVMKEVKLPILGTFEHVSSGSAIVECVQSVMGITSLGAAEGIGQDMLNAGLLRYLGVGNTFANSSVLNYQWRDKALVAAGKIRAGSLTIASRALAMPYVGEYVSTYVTNEYSNESPRQRLAREASQANEHYREAVKKLDILRTDAEATIMEHLQFMERCELDRLKALKAVMMDISAAISNVIPGMKSSMDTMLLFQESISPVGDLKYMVESYRTGTFSPRVIIHENYYNTVDGQTFGVDLELRARQDRKRVPNVVSAILSYMDEHYPQFDTDETRQQVWLKQVPLQLTHELRASINHGKAIERRILSEYDPAIVAASFKLYLLELPDSVVSQSLYEPLKSIYLNYGADDDSEDRVSAISNILQQLPVCNIATLDAITIHFSRLVELTNATDTYKVALARALGQCLVRPRMGSNLTHQDKHPQRLVLDLLDYRKEIFSSLKRASTARPRSATDEKDRKLRMEERNRAISLAGKRTVGQTATGSANLPVSSLRHDHSASNDSQTINLVDRARPPSESTKAHTDLPFLPPNEPEQSQQEHMLSSIDKNTDDHAPRLFENQQSPIAVKKPSLSRSIASGHRLSRHSKQESRSLTSGYESTGRTPEQGDEPTNSDAIGQSGPTNDLPVESSVRGISLEDGDVDYD